MLGGTDSEVRAVAVNFVPCRTMKAFSLIFLLVSGCCAAATEAQRSIEHLPTANGLCYATYHIDKGVVDAFYPHLNDDWDAGYRTPNLVQALGFRMTIGSHSIPLQQWPVANSGYINGTCIIRVEHTTEKASLISYIWAPMILEHKALFWVLHIPAAKRFRLTRAHFLPFIDPPLREVQTVVTEGWDKDDLWVMFAGVYTGGMTPPTQAKVLADLAKTEPKRMVEAEQRWWMHWHLAGHEPADIITLKHEVFRQSLAFIKMAQVREPGPGYGQIVNSLAYGYDKIAVTRDMSYSVAALSAVGHFSEARAALKFMLYSDAGSFRSHRIGDLEWGLGRNYMVSLAHYSGIGFERATSIGDAPRLYFSSHPLFLWALHDYYKHSSDRAFLDQVWSLVKDYVVQPLLFSFADNDLIRADSGLWDAPVPGEQFLYTSAAAFQGLTCAAVLARTLEDAAVLKQCTEKSARLRESILTRLTVGKAKVLARSWEKRSFPELLDSSTMEAVNWGVVLPEWKSARTTLAALDSHLRISPTRGYALGRTLNAGVGEENLFVTLRMIPAMMRMKRKQEADLLWEWVMRQAARNAEMIPEHYDQKTAACRGAYPVIGMGAAAFILAALAR
ncbi:MAG TPA: hypothetical protein PK843_06900 [bacterium]|nr:hypothetical protein [bacterium]